MIYGGYGVPPEEHEKPPTSEEEEEFDERAAARATMIGRLKGVVLVVEFLVMLVFMFFMVQDELSKYANYDEKPLLPIEPVLKSIFIMAVIMGISSIIFKFSEIKVTPSKSRKYLLANASMKSGMGVAIFSIIIAVLFLILPTLDAMSDALTKDDEAATSYSEMKYRFDSQDEFLILKVTNVHFEVKEKYPIHISVLRATLLTDYQEVLKKYRDGSMSEENFQNYLMSKDIIYKENVVSLDVDFKDKRFGEYVIYVENENATTGQLHYIFSIKREIRQPLIDTFVIFGTILFIVYLIWTIVCISLKQRYKKESIYK